MSKPKKKPFYISQLVYEARYRYGYDYLDRCGATINEIMRMNPAWVERGASPQGTELNNLEDGTKVGFTTNSMQFSLIKPAFRGPIDEKAKMIFLAHIKNITPIIMSEFRLDIESFTRIGSKIIYYIPFKTEKEASDWLLKTKWVEFNKSDLFDGILYKPSYRFQWKGDIISHSLIIDIKERNVQLDYGDNILGITSSALSPSQIDALKNFKMRQRMLVNPEYFIDFDFDLFVKEEHMDIKYLLGIPETCMQESHDWLNKLLDQ